VPVGGRFNARLRFSDSKPATDRRVHASDDDKQFERVRIDGRGPQLFGEARGNRTRDPMLLKIGDLWHCYYSAHGGKDGIFVRTSRSLLDWSNSRPLKVAAGGRPGAK
jgi:hypothetical protein